MFNIKPIKSQYSIVDDTESFVVVCKRPGVAVQGAADGLSLVSIVKADLGLSDLFPVHRLDVATSGLVVMAKTKTANQALSTAFQERLVNKYYLAITHKKTSKKQGAVVGDMEKSRKGSYKLTRGKTSPAKTQFFSSGLGDGKRLIVLKPETGKTHQLRVALQSLSAPVIGDERYGGAESDRMYLHAYQLQFTLEGKSYDYSRLPECGEHFLCQPFLDAVNKIGSLQSLAWPQNETKKRSPK